MGRSMVMTMFTLALLMPALYRRHARRTGERLADVRTSRGRAFVVASAAVLALGVLGGIAMAGTGDTDGTKTSVGVEIVLPSGTPQYQQIPTLANERAKH